MAGVKPGELRVTGFADTAIATLDQSLFDRHADSGCTARDPIFVVGLHRSGSTLIEQILASHPLIERTAELPVMQQTWDRIGSVAALSGSGVFREIATLDPAALAAIGE